MNHEEAAFYIVERAIFGSRAAQVDAVADDARPVYLPKGTTIRFPPTHDHAELTLTLASDSKEFDRLRSAWFCEVFYVLEASWQAGNVTLPLKPRPRATPKPVAPEASKPCMWCGALIELDGGYCCGRCAVLGMLLTERLSAGGTRDCPEERKALERFYDDRCTREREARNQPDPKAVAQVLAERRAEDERRKPPEKPRGTPSWPEQWSTAGWES
jgi:hypothetical protein